MQSWADIENRTREDYRRAAMAIANDVRDRRYRSVLLTSASSGEGTTTAVLNIAKELKEHYGLVPLMVEMNYKNPMFANLFQLDSNRSVEAVISEQMTIGECIQKIAPGIGLLPSGGKPWSLNGTGPQWQSQLKNLFDRVEGFDVVLVDAPPILEQTDTIAIGRIVPNAILVVEAGRTRYELVERVKREFENENIMIVGTILNKHRRFIPSWIYRMVTNT